MITWILIGGALSGAGLFALTLILAPPATQPAAALAELARGSIRASLAAQSSKRAWLAEVDAWLAG